MLSLITIVLYTGWAAGQDLDLGSLGNLSTPEMPHVGSIKLKGPTQLFQCQMANFTWSGQEGPYELTVGYVPNLSMSNLSDLSKINTKTETIAEGLQEKSFSWRVDFPKGVAPIVVAVSSSTGEIGVDTMAFYNIGEGPDWCVKNRTGSAGSTASGSPLFAIPTGGSTLTSTGGSGTQSGTASGTASAVGDSTTSGATLAAKSGGLSLGAKVGIAVGSVVGVGILATIAILLCLRRRKKSKPERRPGAVQVEHNPLDGRFEIDSPEVYPSPYTEKGDGYGTNMLTPATGSKLDGGGTGSLSNQPYNPQPWSPQPSQPWSGSSRQSSSPQPWSSSPQLSTAVPTAQGVTVPTKGTTDLQPWQYARSGGDAVLERAMCLLERETRMAAVNPASSAGIVQRAQTLVDLQDIPSRKLYEAAGRLTAIATDEVGTDAGRQARVTAIFVTANRLAAMQREAGLQPQHQRQAPMAAPMATPLSPRAEDAGGLTGNEPILPPLYNPGWVTQPRTG